MGGGGGAWDGGGRAGDFVGESLVEVLHFGSSVKI